MDVNVIPPTISGENQGSRLDKLRDSMQSKNLLKPMMWAAGASMVFVVKVDEAVVGTEKMRRFRDHIDGHNKHVVRLGEKIMEVDDGKQYRVFAFQVRRRIDLDLFNLFDWFDLFDQRSAVNLDLDYLFFVACLIGALFL